MAKARVIQNASWEANLAAVSLAGIRPLQYATSNVAATSEATYTVLNPACKRVVLFHDGPLNTAVSMAINETASANTIPVLPAMYFVVEVDVGDVIHLYNTTGSPILVYITEIR